MECVRTAHSASHVLLNTPFHWQNCSSPDQSILFCHATAVVVAFGLYMHRRGVTRQTCCQFGSHPMIFIPGMCAGAGSQVAAAAAAAAAPSLQSLSTRQLPQLTSIQLLKHRARQHMANASAAPLGSSLPSSFQILTAATPAQLTSSQHPSAVDRSGFFSRASSAEADGHGRAVGFVRPNSNTVFTSAQTVLPRQRSALAQLSALSIDASAQIDLTDSPTAMDASSVVPEASGIQQTAVPCVSPLLGTALHRCIPVWQHCIEHRLASAQFCYTNSDWIHRQVRQWAVGLQHILSLVLINVAMLLFNVSHV